MSLDVAKIKRDFPLLSRKVRHDLPLLYLDSGATSQKPIKVIEAESDFYRFHNSAVHRGAHLIAEEATDIYEGARAKIAHFIGAESVDEVIFTKSATESINLLAYSLGQARPNSPVSLKPGDSIVVSELEHHANLIPWQELAKRTGASLRWFPATEDGRLDLREIEQIIDSSTKIVALTHQSNVTGAITPLSSLLDRAKAVGAITVIDACQSVPHFPVDVQKLGIDFLAFSGHKMVGPTGIGLLWGRKSLLEELPPFLFGGSMVTSVSMSDATFAPVPRKFEAGVPNMAGAAGLGAAVDYLQSIGMDAIHNHELSLTEYALAKLQEIEGLTLIGPGESSDRGAVFSFTLDGIHPHDVGQALDDRGIAVRTGHHCAWPLMKKFGITGTTRATFYLYNSLEDVDRLVEGIDETQRFFTSRGL
ncbi:MAG: cysteine desulfurase [Actinobacteria bacterium]|nr:cysteine desulfurase [Actinomycetota bacterium]